MLHDFYLDDTEKELRQTRHLVFLEISSNNPARLLVKCRTHNKIIATVTSKGITAWSNSCVNGELQSLAFTTPLLWEEEE